MINKKSKFMGNCDAASDVIGALLLTSIAVLAFSTASVFILSTYQGATDTPHVDVDGWVDVESDVITLRHSGGEVVNSDDIKIILDINGQRTELGPANLSLGDGEWELGDTIVINSAEFGGTDIDDGDYVGAAIIHTASRVVVKSGTLLGDEGGSGSGGSGGGGGSGIVGDPISWWDFDEGGINDSISGNDGVINHGATPTEGIDGNNSSALHFDGNGNDEDYIEINQQIISDYPFTLSAWIKTNASNGYIIDAADSSGQTVYYGIYVTGQKAAAIATNPSTVKATGSTTVIDNNWHHIVGVFTSTELKVYVDGNHEDTASHDLPFNTDVDRWVIGGLGTNNVNDHFKGTIDEVLLWDRALTSQQVQELYDSY